MRVVRVDYDKPDIRAIEKAVEVLKLGGLVIYPTDTAYALGADAFNTRAVLDVYAVKRRPLNKYLTVTVSNMKMAEDYAIVTDVARVIMEKFMPGPLTVILPKRRSIPSVVNPRGIGVRIPGCKVALELAEKLGRPVVATSANITGMPPPYSALEAYRQLGSLVHLVLDAGQLPIRKPSTIIDVTGATPVLVREGPIPFSEVLREVRDALARH
ncbi:MAG: threonylcarbamoyl-AMP synthase [Thermoproteota archaeon]|nr:MAG: threonylcarbamoyl-AMP synthase [Candidatus Korarchaeota archaeon]